MSELTPLEREALAEIADRMTAGEPWDKVRHKQRDGVCLGVRLRCIEKRLKEIRL